MAICELLDLTDHIREIILDKRPISEVKRAAKEQGMRLLRESAVERVLEGPDHAAGDQQGDVRRMSLRDLFQTPAPDVAVEIDHTHVGRGAPGVARRPGRDQPRTPASRCRPGLVVPGARRAEHGRRAGAVAGDRARARRSSAAARRRACRWSCPTRWRRCRCSSSRRCRPRPSDLQEIVRWQIRKTRAVPDRAGGAQHFAGRARRRRRQRVRRRRCRAPTSSTSTSRRA